ncbi:hypothetical protein JMJ77_0011770, partial [Colletotrichum scovillei]
MRNHCCMQGTAGGTEGNAGSLCADLGMCCAVTVPIVAQHVSGLILQDAIAVGWLYGE